MQCLKLNMQAIRKNILQIETLRAKVRVRTLPKVGEILPLNNSRLGKKLVCVVSLNLKLGQHREPKQEPPHSVTIKWQEKLSQN